MSKTNGKDATGNPRSDCISEYRTKSNHLQALVDAYEDATIVRDRDALAPQIDEAMTDIARHATEHDITTAELRDRWESRCFRCHTVASTIEAMGNILSKNLEKLAN